MYVREREGGMKQIVFWNGGIKFIWVEQQLRNAHILNSFKALLIKNLRPLKIIAAKKIVWKCSVCLLEFELAMS